MPRQSRGRSSAPRSALPAPAQSRGAHTATAPAGHAPSHAPAPHAAANSAAQPQQPGMLASMAATVGSVAAGSVIGHGISSMLFGGGSTAATQAPAPAQPQASCQHHADELLKCLSDGLSNTDACTRYLEALKECKAAAPY